MEPYISLMNCQWKGEYCYVLLEVKGHVLKIESTFFDLFSGDELIKAKEEVSKFVLMATEYGLNIRDNEKKSKQRYM